MGLGDDAGPGGPVGIDTRGGGGVACRREDDSVRAAGPGGPPVPAAADLPEPAVASGYAERRPAPSGELPFDSDTAHTNILAQCLEVFLHQVIVLMTIEKEGGVCMPICLHFFCFP